MNVATFIFWLVVGGVASVVGNAWVGYWQHQDWMKREREKGGKK